MGRVSKATAARRANLNASVKNPRKATVEDVTGMSDADSQFDAMAQLDTVSDSDPGEDYSPTGFHFAFEEDCEEHATERSEDESESSDFDGEVNGQDDITNEAALLTFINVMQQARDAAVEAERRKETGNKRPKRYSKNSARTERRHAQKRAKIAKDGTQSFLTNWLKAQTSESSGTDSSDQSPAESDIEDQQSRLCPGMVVSQIMTYLTIRRLNMWL